VVLEYITFWVMASGLGIITRLHAQKAKTSLRVGGSHHAQETDKDEKEQD